MGKLIRDDEAVAHSLQTITGRDPAWFPTRLSYVERLVQRSLEMQAVTVSRFFFASRVLFVSLLAEPARSPSVVAPIRCCLSVASPVVWFVSVWFLIWFGLVWFSSAFRGRLARPAWSEFAGSESFPAGLFLFVCCPGGS